MPETLVPLMLVTVSPAFRPDEYAGRLSGTLPICDARRDDIVEGRNCCREVGEQDDEEIPSMMLVDDPAANIRSLVTFFA